MTTSTPGRRAAAAVIGAASVLLVGILIGVRMSHPIATPSTTSAEAGFARDMQVHHTQAVDMSLTVLTRGHDATVHALAYDIARSQQQQSGQMFAWLELWDVPQAAPEPPMTWMSRPPLNGHSATGHQHDQAVTPTMPGYASATSLAELATRTGEAEDQLYLQLMIEHHRGGITMAQAILQRSDNPHVTAIAHSMVNAQRADIHAMQTLQR